MAYDHKVKKLVALKAFRPETRSVQVAKNEAQILKFLNSKDPSDKKNVV